MAKKMKRRYEPLCRLMLITCLLLSIANHLDGQETVTYPCYFGADDEFTDSLSKNCHVFPAGQSGYGVLVQTSSGFQGFSLSTKRDLGEMVLDPVDLSFPVLPDRAYVECAIFEEKQGVTIVFKDLARLSYHVVVVRNELTTMTTPPEFNHKNGEVDLIGYLRVNDLAVAVMRVSGESVHSGYWLGHPDKSQFVLSRVPLIESTIDTMFTFHDFLIVGIKPDRKKAEPQSTKFCIYKVAQGREGLSLELLHSIESSVFSPPLMDVVDIAIDVEGNRIGVLGIVAKSGGEVSVLRVLRFDTEFKLVYEGIIAGETTPSRACFSDNSDEIAVFFTRRERTEKDGRRWLRLFDEVGVVSYLNSTTEIVYSNQRLGRSDVSEVKLIWPGDSSRPFAGWRVFVPWD
jgi:hypothetical protein